jgi:hypothetical protein
MDDVGCIAWIGSAWPVEVVKQANTLTLFLFNMPPVRPGLTRQP